MAAVTHSRRKDAESALSKAATDAARRLKREHRAEYERDPRAFRETVRKAYTRVFRLKPGPHPDPRVAAAARERVRGAKWESLYPRFIDFHSGMPEYTRGLAEDGFKRKVTAYLQKRPWLRRKRQKQTAATGPQ